MARCPYCDHVLSDEWLKSTGATLMGKTSGENKARSREAAAASANERWERVRTEAMEKWEKEEKAKRQKAEKARKQREKRASKKHIPT